MDLCGYSYSSQFYVNKRVCVNYACCSDLFESTIRLSRVERASSSGTAAFTPFQIPQTLKSQATYSFLHLLIFPTCRADHLEPSHWFLTTIQNV